jgi:ABC-type iron transport system FetAB ATPase subunit
LYLRKNQISSFEQVLYLQACPLLQVLWLDENPIALKPDYRRVVISLLPQLVRFDDVDVTKEEKESALNSVHKIENIHKQQELKEEKNTVGDKSPTLYPQTTSDLKPIPPWITHQNSDPDVIKQQIRRAQTEVSPTEPMSRNKLEIESPLFKDPLELKSQSSYLQIEANTCHVSFITFF